MNKSNALKASTVEDNSRTVKSVKANESKLRKLALQYHEAKTLLDKAESVVNELKKEILSNEIPNGEILYVDPDGVNRKLKLIEAEYINLLLERKELMKTLGKNDYEILITDCPKVTDKEMFIGYCKGKGIEEIYTLKPSVSLRIYEDKQK
jgi:hypothetical protein